MVSKKALNARNLEALGAKRLTELLIEISKGRTVAQRSPTMSKHLLSEQAHYAGGYRVGIENA